MTKVRYWLLGMILMLTVVADAQISKLRVFAMDAEALTINKKKIQKGDATLIKAYDALLKKADAILNQPLVTVMEKKQVPPSGDMHDYMSIAIYFWPDPSKPDGLPYIRKDGQINPEVKDYQDKENIGNMCDHVELLALAYYFSGKPKYAEKAKAQLSAWFLDEKTKMNPNFKFAQAVKGKSDGRGTGLIESRNFINVVDAVGLLNGSIAWTNENQQGIENWFKDFLQWMITSKNGIDEMKSQNNHGIWYDAQKLSYALFTYNDEVAGSTVNSVKQRMELQMDTTGFFPAELERTISLHYSAFILDPLMMMANMSSAAKSDLWNYTSSTGRSLRKAFEVLKPYLAQEKEWKGQQIKHFDYSLYAPPILAKGYYKYNCTSCKAAMFKVYEKDPDESIQHLITLID